MTVPCILINVRFIRFQHRTIERSILRVLRLLCETPGHVLSATVKGTPDLCSTSRYFVRSSLRELTSTHNIDWSNDSSEKSVHPSLPASIHRPACELVSSLSLPVVSPSYVAYPQLNRTALHLQAPPPVSLLPDPSQLSLASFACRILGHSPCWSQSPELR